MTEKSYFWDGASHGDAQEAPYTADLFSNIIGLLHTSNDAYVMGTGPVVTANGINMIVAVSGGSSLIQGRYVTLVAKNITVPLNTATWSRIDRIVVRVNKNTHAGVTDIKQGTPSAAPVPAPLVQDDNIYEMSIARIYIPAGATTLNTVNIITECKLYYTFGSTFYSSENIMPNSEFLAGSGTSYDGAPATWLLVGTATCTLLEKFEQMARGSTVQVICPVNADGLSTSVPNLTGGINLPYTVRLLIEILEGEVLITTGGGFPTTAILGPTSGPVEVILPFTSDGTMALAVTNNVAVQTTFRLGQVTLVSGYSVASFLPKKELILFSKPVLQTGYNAAVIINGTSEITLETPIGGGVSSLITRLGISGGNSSATDTCYAALQDIESNANQVRVENGRNHTTPTVYRQGFIGIPFNTSGIQKFQLEVNTAGGASATISIHHLGCRT